MPLIAITKDILLLFTSLIKSKKTFPTKVQLWRHSTRCKPGEFLAIHLQGQKLSGGLRRDRQTSSQKSYSYRRRVMCVVNMIMRM